MTSSKTIEKKAFDKDRFYELLKKYGKYGVSAAALSAGVGLLASKSKEEKLRKTTHDLDKNKDAITVYIKKNKFLEGLPTPEEKADMDAQYQKAASCSGSKINFFSRKKQVGANGKNGAGTPGKRGEDNERVVVRGTDGRFAGHDKSNADGAEKKAGMFDNMNFLDNFANFAAHPVDTAKGMWDAASTHPIATATGIFASVLIATKIVDAVKKIKERKAKEQLDESRKAYIDILHGGEKSAESKPGFKDDDNILSWISSVGGHALVVPAVLSALITHRIIQQRKAEKKKKEFESNSYPEEPYIIYKTAEGKDIGISPETALAAISVKQAIVMDACGRFTEKSAGFWDFARKSGDAFAEVGVDHAIDTMANKKNSENLKNLIEAYTLGGSNPMDHAKKMFNTGDLAIIGFTNGLDQEAFKKKVLANPKFQDMIVGRLNSEEYKDLKNRIVSKKLAVRGFPEGTFLHKLLSFFANMTPVFNWGVKRMLTNRSKVAPQPKVAPQKIG